MSSEDIESKQSARSSYSVNAGNRSILKRIGAQAIQKTFFPNSDSLKRTMDVMDVVVKMEFLHMELCSNLLWGSLFEFCVFIIGIFIFVKNPHGMGLIWAFIPHLVRSVLGFFVLEGLPLTHDIIKSACFPSNERLDLDQVFEYLANATVIALDHFRGITRNALALYFLMTTICQWLDGILFFVAFHNFATGLTPYSDVSLMFITFSFCIADAHYLMWLISVHQRLPEKYSKGLFKAMMGQFKELYEDVERFRKEQIQQRKEKKEAKKRAYLNQPDDTAVLPVMQTEVSMVRVVES